MAKASKVKTTWRSDDLFMEFAGYTVGTLLNAPLSSGYSLIGAGGAMDIDIPEDEIDGDYEDRDVVLAYLQNLDNGKNIEIQMTPEAARRFADQLNQWADEAEGANETADARIEKLRLAHYDKAPN